MVSIFMVVSVATVALPIIGYIYAGDWDSLIELIRSHTREIACVIEAIALFIAGYLRRYRLGAMICGLLIVTITWGSR